MNRSILSPMPKTSGDENVVPLGIDRPPPVRRAIVPIPALVGYWRTIAERRWLVLGVAALVALPAGIAAFTAAPIYESSVLMLIHQGKSRIVSIEEVYGGGSSNREHLLTQAELIKSRNVAERVIDKLNLVQHPGFNPRQPSSAVMKAVGAVTAAIEWLKPGPATTPSPDEVRAEVIRKLQRNLDVQLVRLSQLAKISYQDKDPQLAAAIANAVADAYLQADLDARYSMTVKANSWLNEQTSKLKTNLLAAERALQEFRDQKGLIDKQSAAQGGQARQLEALTQRLVDARVRRSQAEQAMVQLRTGGDRGSESLPAVLADPLVSRTREARSVAQQKLAEISQRLGPAHPLYQAARAELTAAEQSVKQAVQSVVAGITREYEVARALEDSIARSIGTSQRTIQAQNRDEFELGSYEREVNTNRQLLETFLARAKETSLTADIHSPSAMILDDAVPESTPVSPRKAQTILLAAALGLVLGAVIAFQRQSMYQGLSSVEAAETRLGFPVLAAVPMLDKSDVPDAHRQVTLKPDSHFSEAIRTIRTSLLLSGIDTPNTIVAVTSSQPGEGKSTIAFNLALALSQTVKTLFIECDMRRPSLRLSADSPDAAGLSEVLAGRLAFEACVSEPQNSSLSVLSSGTVPPNPLEMLSSRKFSALLRVLASKYEMIVLDTAPVAVVSDAVVVASHATSVVFVVKADDTPYRLAQRSISRVLESGTPVVGIVMNQMDFRKAQTYHGEYSAVGGERYYGSYGRASVGRHV